MSETATSSLGFSVDTRRALAGLGVAFGIATLVLGVILLLLHTARCSRYPSRYDRDEGYEEEEEEEEEERMRPLVIMSRTNS
jgi:hypothetical protein